MISKSVLGSCVWAGIIGPSGGGVAQHRPENQRTRHEDEHAQPRDEEPLPELVGVGRLAWLAPR